MTLRKSRGRPLQKNKFDLKNLSQRLDNNKVLQISNTKQPEVLRKIQYILTPYTAMFNEVKKGEDTS